jgi:hypothetical protein
VFADSEILHGFSVRRRKGPAYSVRDYHDIDWWLFYSIQKGLNLQGSEVEEILERVTEKSLG